jgi:hypothetical protein
MYRMWFNKFSMHINRILYPLLLVLAQQTLVAQVIGGQSVFEHLSMSPTARITALGGAAIAISDKDLSLALHHPAALNQQMSGRVYFQHQFYLADLQNGAVGYARHLPKLRITAQTGIQYMNYGKITQADVFGNKEGEVQAGEWAWTVGAARAFTPKLSLGLNARLAGAHFAEYKSTALLADASLMYSDTASRMVVAVVLKNSGAQLSTFNGTRESLPTDLQIGISKRLRYMPFRFSIIAHHLQQWDIRYNDPNDQTTVVEFLGQDQGQSKGNPKIDNAFRHLIFNGEFLLGKNENLMFRLGYNHLRKRELSVRNLRSLAGFSGGIGMQVKRFRVDMGFASYHLAGGGFHLGIGTDLDGFRS